MQEENETTERHVSGKMHSYTVIGAIKCLLGAHLFPFPSPDDRIPELDQTPGLLPQTGYS